MDRLYQDDELTVRLRGLGSPDGVRIHVEHRSGAALIVPSCPAEERDGEQTLQLTGFDGTTYALYVAVGAIRITASGPSALLGGKLEHRAPRGADPIPVDRGVRVTGDESTMPIDVDD